MKNKKHKLDLRSRRKDRLPYYIVGCHFLERFNCLKKITCALLSAFGSTYLCEQIFSYMKHILSPQRSRLTTEHLESCVKLKVTNYTP